MQVAFDAAAVKKGCCLQGDRAVSSGIAAAAFGVGTCKNGVVKTTSALCNSAH
jgi:hypothetical protein